MANKGGDAFLQAFDVPPELKTPIIQYLGLFRSVGRDLSFDRVAKLLAELNPIIHAGKVTFDRHTFDTPSLRGCGLLSKLLKPVMKVA